VVANLDLTQQDLQELGSQLRKACGSGGTVKDGAVEIQGDHRDRVAEVLHNLGYRTKQAQG
jgi:translation initiation factor 1